MALLLEVPSFSSWQAKLSKGVWFHLDAPRHSYHFSIKALLEMLKSNNFKICRRSPFSLEYGQFGMIQSLLNIFSTQPNFVYSLLKNRHANLLAKKEKSFFRDIVINIGLLIPKTILGPFLKFTSVLVNKGGVIRITSRKQ